MHKNQEKKILNQKRSLIVSSTIMGILTTLVIFLLTITVQQIDPAFASTQGNNNQQLNINATSLYETRTMTLGHNVKNLLILIPNEAHEPYSLKEQQLINQAFIPQHVTINIGTTISFFNADVGHAHREILTTKVNSAQIFDTKKFDYDKKPASSSIFTFDKTGDFSYYDTVFTQKIMNGTIKVVANNNNNNTTSNNSSGSSSSSVPSSSKYPHYQFDTIGAFVVPTKTLDKYLGDFEKQGFNIYDTHNFTNFMSKSNSKQSLIVWTSNGQTLSSIISKLQKITPTLPYS
jgi:plastocyanin